MKYSIKLLFMLAILMALSITLTATQPQEEVLLNEKYAYGYGGTSNKIHGHYIPPARPKGSPFSLRGSNHFFWLKMSCDKHPRICRGKWSPGRDCCNNRCVNVLTDRSNCGRCGNKCKFSETCCKGKCVNPFSNTSHCGGCNNKCKNGSSCFFGMCSYA